jgi:hypothetical protein
MVEVRGEAGLRKFPNVWMGGNFAMTPPRAAPSSEGIKIGGHRPLRRFEGFGPASRGYVASGRPIRSGGE